MIKEWRVIIGCVNLILVRCDGLFWNVFYVRFIRVVVRCSILDWLRNGISYELLVCGVGV